MDLLGWIRLRVFIETRLDPENHGVLVPKYSSGYNHFRFSPRPSFD